MAKKTPVLATETPNVADAIVAAASAFGAPPAPIVTKGKAPKLAGTITLVQPINPKEINSKARARYALYTTGMSTDAYVEACIAAGQSRRNATGDLPWDTKRGYITID